MNKILIATGAVKLLLLLLLADLAFIVVHIFYKVGLVTNPLVSIEEDFTYPEMYQYIKELWIASSLFALKIRRGHIIYFLWSALFMYLLLDDSLSIHETLGAYLANYFEFQPMFNLRAKDFGELSVSMLAGSLLFTFIGIAYLSSGDTGKQISKSLFMLVMSLAFFGVIVDMLHIAILWGRPVWGLIEDGGEMIMMSVIVWYVFSLRDHQKIASPRTDG